MQSDRFEAIAMLLVVPTLIWIVWRSWQGKLANRHIAILLGTLMFLLFTTHPDHAGATGPDGSITFTFVMLPIACSAMISRFRTVIGISIATILLYVSGRSFHEGLPGALAALDEGVSAGTVNIGIYMILSAMRKVAKRTDCTHELAIFAAESLAEEVSRETALTEIRRTLHDDVIATLRFTELQLGTATTVQQEACTATVEGLRREKPVTYAPNLSASISRVANRHPLTISATFSSDFAAVLVPIEVSGAFARAVGEALRNVAAHAQTGQAEIYGDVADGHVSIEVRDHGVGYSGTSNVGFGIRHSIEGPLATIGGHSEIISSLGGGTTVRLTWETQSAAKPAPLSRQQHTKFHALLDDIGSLIFPLGFVLWLGKIFLAARYIPRSNSVPLGVLAAVVLTLIIGVVLWRIVTAIDPIIFVLLEFAALALATHWALLIAGNGALNGFESWSAGMTSAPLVAIALARSAMLSLSCATMCSAAISFAAIADPTVSPLDVYTAIFGPILFTLIAVAISRGAHRIRRAAHTAEEATAKSSVAKIAVRTRLATIEGSIAFLDDAIIPFLSAVADGYLDLSEPSVRNQAHALCIQARDELHFPGMLNADIRNALAEARRAGCTITIRHAEHPRAAEEAMRLLRTALDLPDRPKTIVLTVAGDESRRTRLVIIPPTRNPIVLDPALDSDAISMSSDEFSTTITHTPTPDSPPITGLPQFART